MALAGALALAAYVDVLLVGAVVVVVQLIVALASAPVDDRGRSIPSPRFAAAVAAGLVATGVTLVPRLLDGADGSRSTADVRVASGTLAALLPAIAAAVLVTLIAEMRRTDGRRELVSSAGYAVSLGVFSALAVGWIGAAQALDDPDVVVVASAGIVAGTLFWMAPVGRWWCGGLVVLVGAGAGALVVLQLDSVVTMALGVALGAASALFAVLGQVIGRAWAHDRPHASAGWGFPGAMSIALVGPVVYVGGQLVGVPGLT